MLGPKPAVLCILLFALVAPHFAAAACDERCFIWERSCIRTHDLHDELKGISLEEGWKKMYNVSERHRTVHGSGGGGSGGTAWGLRGLRRCCFPSYCINPPPPPLQLALTLGVDALAEAEDTDTHSELLQTLAALESDALDDGTFECIRDELMELLCGVELSKSGAEGAQSVSGVVQASLKLLLLTAE